MKAQPLVADSVDAIERQLQALRAGGFFPTLAIVFASIAHEMADVARVFRDAGIDVFGPARR